MSQDINTLLEKYETALESNETREDILQVNLNNYATFLHTLIKNPEQQKKLPEGRSLIDLINQFMIYATMSARENKLNVFIKPAFLKTFVAQINELQDGAERYAYYKNISRVLQMRLAGIQASESTTSDLKYEFNELTDLKDKIDQQSIPSAVNATEKETYLLDLHKYVSNDNENLKKEMHKARVEIKITELEDIYSKLIIKLKHLKTLSAGNKNQSWKEFTDQFKKFSEVLNNLSRGSENSANDFFQKELADLAIETIQEIINKVENGKVKPNLAEKIIIGVKNLLQTLITLFTRAETQAPKVAPVVVLEPVVHPVRREGFFNLSSMQKNINTLLRNMNYLKDQLKALESIPHELTITSAGDKSKKLGM